MSCKTALANEAAAQSEIAYRSHCLAKLGNLNDFKIDIPSCYPLLAVGTTFISFLRIPSREKVILHYKGHYKNISGMKVGLFSTVGIERVKRYGETSVGNDIFNLTVEEERDGKKFKQHIYGSYYGLD
ncbi:hypothetical protein AVEN_268776-1 [Araneus ventricosus]|uniref:Uncharacterized protein n=1 Tax=Araneus ventricosus TaxID=182803 RepID=A0A4Y2K9R1_ARAVE|nr:hypothetical protein AVEN_268776-1 [Araneus ventricosus]